ncbi:hypothetical protein CesoFtcFv8_000093 [Champsocephalus esox]|uniref:Vesicle transport protein n=1 Tax=Champsocephalus esox TaxID=159716 RepID=A0AAN8I4T7_9TELE|nr:hypothetical protein CesoFtcFv8_000093 [Champsocephalus esox]
MADLNRQLQEYLSQTRRARAPAPAAVFPGPGAPEPDACLPGLTRGQRLVGAALFAALSALCFALSALYAPLLLLYARKFALLWSLGSLFAIASAAVLRGPAKLFAGLRSSPAFAVYLCALGGTLYAALHLHSTALTALGAALQVAVIAVSVVSLVPGGSAGMRFMSGAAAAAIKRTVSGKSLPI